MAIVHHLGSNREISDMQKTLFLRNSIFNIIQINRNNFAAKCIMLRKCIHLIVTSFKVESGSEIISIFFMTQFFIWLLTTSEATMQFLYFAHIMSSLELN